MPRKKSQPVEIENPSREMRWIISIFILVLFLAIYFSFGFWHGDELDETSTLLLLIITLLVILSVHIRWVRPLLILFIAIGWFAALYSYSPSDPPSGASDKWNTVQNALGPVGSYIAFFTIELTYGRYLTFLFPLLLAWVTIYLFIPTLKPPILKGFLPIIVAGWLASCWLAYFQSFSGFFDDSFGFETSGFLGAGFVRAVNDILYPLGTGLLILLLTLVLFGILFGARLFHWWQRRRFEKSFAVETPAPKVVKQKKSEKPTPIPKALPPQVLETITASGVRIVKPEPAPVVEENSPDEQFDESKYELPPLDLFIPNTEEASEEPYEELAEKLLVTLQEFNVKAKVNTIHPGPVVTRYDFVPGPGVKVSQFANLSDDIARAMRAISVRILAPIPGEEAVGIEIPNRKPRIVRFHEVVESALFQKESWILPVAVGLTTDGQPVVTDLAKLPHLLIAGTTGSGKSVFINCLLGSLLLRRTPNEVKIALIDPKQLELTPYKVLSEHHLVRLAGADPVVTKPAQAVKLLQACVAEMERRLELLTRAGVRDLKEYRERHKQGHPAAEEPLSYIVVVIDELADLMLASAKEVEDPIQRISQMARAVGIHLIVATQRPSVNVITGVIKANLPARLAFQVASSTDSRTILDQTGAEKLLGRGDALFSPPWEMKPVRVHGCLIEGRETEKLLEWIAAQPQSQPLILEPPRDDKGGDGDNPDERDQLFAEAARVCVRAGQGSVAIIRRRMRVGYSRAGRLLDQLEQAGIVGRFDGSKPREILISMETLEEMLARDDDQS